MKVEMGGSGEELGGEIELRFIDEHVVVASETEAGTRHYLASHVTINGDVSDPCLSGVVFRYRREANTNHVEVTSNHLLAKTDTTYVLRQFPTLGVGLEFPEKASIGESLDISLKQLAPLLGSGDLMIESADSVLTFKSFDTSGCATFQGVATLRERAAVGEQVMTTIYKGDIVIRTCPAEARVLSVRFAGRVHIEQEGSDQSSGEGEFEVQLVTEIGNAVDEARKAKPRIRTRVFRVPEAELALKLPGFYTSLAEHEGRFEYLRTPDSADGNAIINIKVEDDIPLRPEQYFDGVEAELEKDPASGLIGTHEITSPLGVGRAFLIDNNDKEGFRRFAPSAIRWGGTDTFFTSSRARPEPLPTLCPSSRRRGRRSRSGRRRALHLPRAFEVEVIGSGKPMILIPGLGCSGAVWNETVRRFQDRYTCHVLTLAGFAGVPPVRGADPFLETVLKDLAKYIRDEDLGGCVILGHSLGAFLALALAAHEPDLPGKVIAVDGVPFSPALLDPEATVDTCRAQAELLKKAMDPPRPRELRRMEATPLVRGMLRNPEEADVVVRWIVDSDGPTLSRAYYESTITDLRPRMKDVRAPVLLLASLADMGPEQRDRLRSMHRKQLEAVRDARISFHETARHFILFDEPEWFFREVEAFIEPKVPEEPPAKAATTTGAPRE